MLLGKLLCKVNNILCDSGERFLLSEIHLFWRMDECIVNAYFQLVVSFYVKSLFKHGIQFLNLR